MISWAKSTRKTTDSDFGVIDLHNYSFTRCRGLAIAYWVVAVLTLTRFRSDLYAHNHAVSPGAFREKLDVATSINKVLFNTTSQIGFQRNIWILGFQWNDNMITF
jgi:hypothetical protein